MTDNTNSQLVRTDDIKVDEPLKFKGYSLEEIRYQRALVMLRREFAKQKINAKVSSIKKNNILSGSPSASKASGFMRAGSVAAKIVNGLSYMDYVMIGFSAFGTVKKVVSFFRRKKK